MLKDTCMDCKHCTDIKVKEGRLCRDCSIDKQDRLAFDVCDKFVQEGVLKDNVSFSVALDFLKSGKKIKRAGWNGKNQYLMLATHISFRLPNDHIVNADHEQMGNKAIVFFGTAGMQVGWLASQADLLAEDWLVIG